MIVLDLWDVIAIVGLALLLGGAAAVYWPLALIVGGSLLLGAYYLRERSLATQPPAEPVAAESDGTGD